MSPAEAVIHEAERILAEARVNPRAAQNTARLGALLAELAHSLQALREARAA